MADNEFLRQKREREFQQRVLAAVEKPKENRGWKFVNSGIVIWGLSVALITIGGGYITNHQQCMRDADQLIERRDHLTSEIWSRNLAFEAAVDAAETMSEALLVPNSKGSYFFDLAKISTTELERELLKLNFRVKRTNLPLREIDDARAGWSQFTQADIDFDHAALQAELNDAAASGTSGQSLKLFKAQVRRFVSVRSFERNVDTFAYVFEPNCSVINTLLTALGYRPPIIFASVSPLLTSEGSTFPNMFKDEIRNIDKLQAAITALRADQGKPK